MNVGGFTKRDVDDPEVQKVAKFATSELNKKSNSLYPLVINKIIDAKSQVIRGIRWVITIELKHNENVHKQRVYVIQEPGSGSMKLEKHEVV
jgi:hypothetical protein